jgi:hypothetical protein
VLWGRFPGVGGRYRWTVFHTNWGTAKARESPDNTALLGSFCVSWNWRQIKTPRLKELRYEKLSTEYLEITVVIEYKKRYFGTKCNEEMYIFNCSTTYYFHIQKDDEQKINFSDKHLLLHP